MTGLGRSVEPVVVATIHVADRRGCERGRRQVVECRQHHRDVVSADLLDVAVRVEANTTVLAEHMTVLAALPKAVLADLILPSEQPECVGLDADRPVAHLPAVAAVALASALGEIEIRLEADRTTVTASSIRLVRHAEPLPPFRSAAKLANPERTAARASVAVDTQRSG